MDNKYNCMDCTYNKQCRPVRYGVPCSEYHGHCDDCKHNGEPFPFGQSPCEIFIALYGTGFSCMAWEGKDD